ncbi:hypothetical protein [Enterobacter cloacae complex sp. 280C5]|uniref:hypothetical protein n=1 Tax=Enterobacter cloacae complex TaxID=354276 RepID=UPI0037F58933
MAWQGIPYPVAGNLGLLIEKIPHIDVTTDSGFGWDTIVASVAGAFIAAAIPALIAWWSIKNSNKTLREDRAVQLRDIEHGRDTQIKLAEESRKAQVIASNRLVWIKDLREASAEFVASAVTYLSISQKYVLEVKSSNHPAITQNEKADLLSSIAQTKIELHAAMIQLVLHSTRIQLMLNPERADHIRVINAMNQLKTHSEDMVKNIYDLDGEEANKYLNQFVSDMQRLLKEDWEKAKRNT